MSRNWKVGFVALAIIAIGAIVLQQRALARLSSDFDASRAGAISARNDADAAQFEVGHLQRTLQQREERFRAMSSARAALVNEYVVRAERLGFAANEVVFNGRTIQWLADYWYGESQSYAYERSSVDQIRAGCGMRLRKPRTFPHDDVHPVPAEWRSGVRPPSS